MPRRKKRKENPQPVTAQASTSHKKARPEPGARQTRSMTKQDTASRPNSSTFMSSSSSSSSSQSSGVLPAQLIRNLHVDMGESQEEQKRRQDIRDLLEEAAKNNLGWDALEERFTTLRYYRSRFFKDKKRVKQNGNDASIIDFVQGRPKNLSNRNLIKVAQKVIERHAVGDEMTQLEVKQELRLDGTVQTSKRHMNVVAKAMKNVASVSLTAVDTSTVA